MIPLVTAVPVHADPSSEGASTSIPSAQSELREEIMQSIPQTAGLDSGRSATAIGQAQEITPEYIYSILLLSMFLGGTNFAAC